MKILVTGSNGQLGRELQALSPEFPSFSFIFTDVNELNITDGPAVLSFIQTNHPDVIINCAAYTNVDKAEIEFSNAKKINASAVANLVTGAIDIDALFIQISTDFIFGGERTIPYLEDDTPRPLSIYAKTKYEGELETYSRSFNSVIIRTSWLYSEYGHNFVKTIIDKGGALGNLKVVYDQIGSPTYARDLARTILTIIPKIGHLDRVQTFHYSNEGLASWYDFAQSIVEYSGIKCKIQPVRTSEYPLPAKRPTYSVMDKSKIKKTFGLEIPDWRKSLKECIQKINDNLSVV